MGFFALSDDPELEPEPELLINCPMRSSSTTEDWVWHFLLPATAYVTVLLAGVLLGRGAVVPLFALAAATLLLLCVGIHNAWDTVTYLTINALRNVAPAADSAPVRHQNPGPRRRRRR